MFVLNIVMLLLNAVMLVLNIVMFVEHCDVCVGHCDTRVENFNVCVELYDARIEHRDVSVEHCITCVQTSAGLPLFKELVMPVLEQCRKSFIRFIISARSSIRLTLCIKQHCSHRSNFRDSLYPYTDYPIPLPPNVLQKCEPMYCNLVYTPLIAPISRLPAFRPSEAFLPYAILL